MPIIDKIIALFSSSKNNVSNNSVNTLQNNISTNKLELWDSFIAELFDEVKRSSYNYYNVSFKDFELFNKFIEHTTIDDKREFTVHTLQLHKQLLGVHAQYTQQLLLKALFSQMMKHVYFENGEQLSEVFDLYIPETEFSYYGSEYYPISINIKQIKEHIERNGKIEESIKKAINTFVTEIKKTNKHVINKVTNKLIYDLEILTKSDDEQICFLQIGDNAFEALNQWLVSLKKEDAIIISAIMQIGIQLPGSKCNKKSNKEIEQLITKIGKENLKSLLIPQLEYLKTIATVTTTLNTYYTTIIWLNPINVEMIKGWVWALGIIGDKECIYTIGNFADACFRKIAGVGYYSTMLGNATLFTMANCGQIHGLTELTRLLHKVKLPSTKKIIIKYLSECAKALHKTIDEIEELALEDFGFENFTKSIPIGNYFAEITLLSAGHSDVKWKNANNEIQKSIPSAIKTSEASELKKIKDFQKRIDSSTSIVKQKLDYVYKKNRTWIFEDFDRIYIKNEIGKLIATKLIWTVTFEEKRYSLFYLNHAFVTATNETIEVPTTAIFSLWHPATDSLKNVEAWRMFMFEHQIVQPFKQAFREVYLLTEAEINTKTYSNRMAAHILKQAQFDKLAKSRSWLYLLQGGFDNGANAYAEIIIPEYNLSAQYWVNPASEATTDAGIYTYLTSDQVRFYSTNNHTTPEELIDIPPIIFSEVMRDVDLFVGVASIGGDANWMDNGADANQYNQYWQQYSFGDLTESGKMRFELLQKMIPRIKIKDQLTLSPKFLIVKGKLRTYKIHLGSSNILMEPNDQYLCIVPDRSSTKEEKLFIPFDGDGILSVIISKALLLASDDTIRDSTITSQINYK